MNRNKQCALLLLAGGKSSRMGKDKALLWYKEKTFMDTLLGKAKILGIDEVYLSGHHTGEEQVQVVWDIYPDRGPLGGIHACMSVMSAPYCLVIPVDVPQIPEDVLEQLLDYHADSCKEHNEQKKKVPLILQHGDRKEYLIGIYPRCILQFIENRIKDHPASVHGVLEDWGYECFEMDIPDWQVANINTKREYERMEIILKGDYSIEKRN